MISSKDIKHYYRMIWQSSHDLVTLFSNKPICIGINVSSDKRINSSYVQFDKSHILEFKSQIIEINKRTYGGIICIKDGNIADFDKCKFIINPKFSKDINFINILLDIENGIILESGINIEMDKEFLAFTPGVMPNTLSLNSSNIDYPDIENKPELELSKYRKISLFNFAESLG